MHHHVDKDKSNNMQPYLDTNPWCVVVVRQNRAKILSHWGFCFLAAGVSFIISSENQ
jgi:hypothetical protein